MRIMNDMGLVKALLLVAALVAANVFVARSTKDLAAQDCSPSRPCTPAEGDDTKCSFPVPLPGNVCEAFPGFFCTIATCTDTALEP